MPPDPPRNLAPLALALRPQRSRPNLHGVRAFRSSANRPSFASVRLSCRSQASHVQTCWRRSIEPELCVLGSRPANELRPGFLGFRNSEVEMHKLFCIGSVRVKFSEPKSQPRGILVLPQACLESSLVRSANSPRGSGPKLKAGPHAGIRGVLNPQNSLTARLQARIPRAPSSRGDHRSKTDGSQATELHAPAAAQVKNSVKSMRGREGVEKEDAESSRVELRGLAPQARVATMRQSDNRDAGAKPQGVKPLRVKRTQHTWPGVLGEKHVRTLSAKKPKTVCEKIPPARGNWGLVWRPGTLPAPTR
ncbi:hypothetical protein Bbelb_140660 [Branchiostoma belcheri]|nr:hypothetical protein Bbelb_140660 [Branchiostoma belcheri]